MMNKYNFKNIDDVLDYLSSKWNDEKNIEKIVVITRDNFFNYEMHFDKWFCDCFGNSIKSLDENHPLAKKYGIHINGNSGSAILKFTENPDNLNELRQFLIDNGYSVFIDKKLKQPDKLKNYGTKHKSKYYIPIYLPFSVYPVKLPKLTVGVGIAIQPYVDIPHNYFDFYVKGADFYLVLNSNGQRFFNVRTEDNTDFMRQTLKIFQKLIYQKAKKL